jgi:predicted phosphodiesterase
MKIAALYDIHGNLPALQAVLQDVRRAGVDRIIVGGDVVPGPMPRDTIHALRGFDVPCQYLSGNGDRVVLTARAGGDISGEVPEPFGEIVRWSAAQVDNDAAEWMGRWPPTIRLAIRGLGDVLFCHATPRNDTEIFTRLTPEERVAPLFEDSGAAVVVCGHTHMQFDRVIGKSRVINAGSVGMPFQEAGAYWLLLGPDVQLRRTEYDLAAAAAAVRRTAYPQAEDFATRNVLNPPSEQTMLDMFEAVAVK